MIRIKKGLNIPINGSPTEEIVDSTRSRSVAILGNDYIGMKPTMLVEEGERVKLGQALFEDKKNPGVEIGVVRIDRVGRLRGNISPTPSQ